MKSIPKPTPLARPVIEMTLPPPDPTVDNLRRAQEKFMLALNQIRLFGQDDSEEQPLQLPPLPDTQARSTPVAIPLSSAETRPMSDARPMPRHLFTGRQPEPIPQPSVASPSRQAMFGREKSAKAPSLFAHSSLPAIPPLAIPDGPNSVNQAMQSYLEESIVPGTTPPLAQLPYAIPVATPVSAQTGPLPVANQPGIFRENPRSTIESGLPVIAPVPRTTDAIAGQTKPIPLTDTAGIFKDSPRQFIGSGSGLPVGSPVASLPVSAQAGPILASPGVYKESAKSAIESGFPVISPVSKETTSSRNEQGKANPYRIPDLLPEPSPQKLPPIVEETQRKQPMPIPPGLAKYFPWLVPQQQNPQKQPLPMPPNTAPSGSTVSGISTVSAPGVPSGTLPQFQGSKPTFEPFQATQSLPIPSVNQGGKDLGALAAGRPNPFERKPLVADEFFALPSPTGDVLAEPGEYHRRPRRRIRGTGPEEDTRGVPIPLGFGGMNNTGLGGGMGADSGKLLKAIEKLTEAIVNLTTATTSKGGGSSSWGRIGDGERNILPPLVNRSGS